MTAKIFKSGNSLALRLPRELQPKEGMMVEIESIGERWIISPAKKAEWPKNFFSRIRLKDPESFKRPPQGEHRDVLL